MKLLGYGKRVVDIDVKIRVNVAIKKDEEATFFQVVDYGLVGGLFTMMPDLRERMSRA